MEELLRIDGRFPASNVDFFDAHPANPHALHEERAEGIGNVVLQCFVCGLAHVFASIVSMEVGIKQREDSSTHDLQICSR
jgi:hypothetical protein